MNVFDIEKVHKVHTRFARQVGDAIHQAEHALIGLGVTRGQEVKSVQDEKTYRITRIEARIHTFSSATIVKMNVYGNRRRKDGTFGDHEHWIGSLDQLA